MVNQANIIIVVLLSLTLLSMFFKLTKLTANLVFSTFIFIDRLLCLLYSIFIDENEDVKPQSLKSFVYFELPFWYLNMATVIHFFEW